MAERISRREFLHFASLVSGAAFLPTWAPRLTFTPEQTSLAGDVLVVIFLRGAADVLNMVVPHGEEMYYRLRPALGIPRPDDRRVKPEHCAINLDGFFGLHPALRPLLPAWQDGRLAIVHACGAPDESRSHFKAMEMMERGVEDERGPASGWIGRHLATLQTHNASPLRVVGFGSLPQRSLLGSTPVAALRSIADAHLSGSLQMLTQMQAALSTLYTGEQPLQKLGRETLHILSTLQALDPLHYTPSHGAVYPESEFGMSLRQVAMLIKAQVGLEVAAVDFGGWDTHFAQGGPQGLMANLLAEYAQATAAFLADLDEFLPGLTVVVMSEFGRRAAENGSLGTDHGHGSTMFLMGGNVQGSKVHGRWPGLAPEQLVGPGDLAVTTDYRAVLSEICLMRLKNPSANEIFPGFQPRSETGSWVKG